ncbi:MAG: TIGR04086 family membrane protein [Eubacteriales bacterium]|nr:TIGR04086 family membrane protein [Eubacteriales bacterium]
MKVDEAYIVDGRKKIIAMLTGLGIAAVLTFLLLSFFAFVMLKTERVAEMESAGAIVISILSCFAGGFFCGKKNSKKRYLWGLSVGLLYFFFLLLIRQIGGGGGRDAISWLTTFLYCAGSGMLGGMIS